MSHKQETRKRGVVVTKKLVFGTYAFVLPPQVLYLCIFLVKVQGRARFVLHSSRLIGAGTEEATRQCNASLDCDAPVAQWRGRVHLHPTCNILAASQLPTSRPKFVLFAAISFSSPMLDRARRFCVSFSCG